MKHPFILGLDVASKKLDLCVYDSSSNTPTTAPTITIDYTDAALQDFLAQYSNLNKDNCIVGLESTGDYHLKAARFFLESGFQVKLLNPILTKQYTRTTIRGTKTDKTDAQLICNLIAQGHGDPLSLDTLQNEQKELLRIAGGLTKISTQLQLKLQSMKRKELDSTVSIQQRVAELIDEIKGLADDTVAQATQNRTEDEKLIDSIPGFATKLSAIVRHEIGDIRRFKSSKSLVAYAGLDPRIKQSGDKLNTTGRLTKRGSPYLRAGLFLAANVARMHDSELEIYYEKKKGEGRSHREVLCIISRKLLNRIYAILKERREYIRRP